MNFEKIDQLLAETNALFITKNLQNALSKAERALVLSNEKNYPLGKLKSNILIGKTYITQGKYIGDPDHFSKALKCLQSSEAHLQNLPTDKAGEQNLSLIEGEKISLYLAIGDVYQHTSQLDEAREYYSKAFEESNENRIPVGVVKSLASQSEIFILKNKFVEALELAQMSLKYLEGTDDPLLKADVYNLLCKIHVKRQEYTEILEYSKEVLAISEAHGDVEKELIALNNLAIYYGVKLDYKTAVECLYTSLEKSKAIQYDRQTAQNLVNLGTIYAQLFNYDEALENYKTVLEKYSGVFEDTNKTILYNNIGNIYITIEAVEEAKGYFLKALELAEQIKYQEMIALALAQLSKTSIEQKDFEKAPAYANRAKALLKNLGDVEAKAVNLINFGRISHQLGNFEEATNYIKDGIKVAKIIKNEMNEIECYRLLNQFYKENQQYEQAIHYQDLYVEQQVHFLKKQRNRQLLDLEIKFVTKEKQQQIDALQKENELQALLLKKQEELKLKNEQLTQANDELHQFARVTSHDLKEPLRMIGSYTQLINKRFSKFADNDSQIFFHYVTDGVSRMKNLLEDLMKYTTVGSGQQPLKPVRILDVIDVSRHNLSLLIEETQTVIEVNNLPTVMGIQSLLSQFFQNMISNAIKFKKPDVNPHIIISGEEKDNEFLVSIKDNGIGIDPEYKDRIFVIFQRLHARDEYEGTGIGLAICHKIIKRLGGNIWVESQLGEGATFWISFPKRNQENPN